MNPEATPEAVPVPPPVAKPSAIWLEALRLIRHNPRETLLPVAVTQLPFALITAIAFFYLFHTRYPSAEFKTLESLADGPDGVRVAIILVSAAQTLFGLVGAAATVVVAEALRRGVHIRLVDALDPAFTRMGGLLALGSLYFAMFFGTLVGVIVLIYFLIRFGLALHAFALEGGSVSGSLGASWRVLRGRMMKFTALLLTVPGLGIVVIIAGSLIVTIISLPFGSDPSRDQELVTLCLSVLVGGIFSVPLYAYFAVSTTFFYLNAKEESRA